MIADQLTHDRLTYRPDHLDIEMCRGVHGFAPQAPGDRRTRRRREHELDGRRGVQHDHSDRASSTSSAALAPRSRRGSAARRSRTSSRAGSSAISASRARRKSLRLICCRRRGPSARGEARRERCGSEPWRTCCKHIGHVKHMSGCRCDRLGRVGVNPRRARGHGRVQTFAMQPCELTAVALTATPPPAPPSLRRAPASTSPRLA